MNKVTLIGRLTKDVEIRSTAGGRSVATFTLATDRKFKNAAGEKVADFHNIVVWGKLADLCGRYLYKGNKAAIVGELQNRSYEAKDGTKRYITEVIADEVEFLSEKSKADTVAGFTEIDDEDLPFA